ncbi:MAG: hypothetical protein M3082_01920 [Candidatus Dormibacteraeota bacterium]|nr:hypothetical protein [Candidatus Dormibacteraeota bacterium]
MTRWLAHLLGRELRRRTLPWGVGQPLCDVEANAEIAVLVVMHAVPAAVITRGLISVRR